MSDIFPTRKRIFHLHVNGNVIRTTADHPFFVHGQGWTDAADLQQGDKLRTVDGSNVPIDTITEEQAVVHQMQAGVPPFPCTGLWPAGGNPRPKRNRAALISSSKTEPPQ
jgi:hypothetical protein